MSEGVLVLEDGTEFSGELFGAPISAKVIRDRSLPDRGYGEAVFNTSLTGYQEILTDPSYFGQVICMTPSHIGNTGINAEDVESSKIWCAGYVIREIHRQLSSNWRSKRGLEDYLKENGVPGLWGVDTRALTKHLRSMGVTRAIILPAEERKWAKELLNHLPKFAGRDLIGEVTTSKPYFWPESASERNKYRVVAVDFGLKWNLLRELSERGCRIQVVPAKTPAQEILAQNPDGIFLSNGPGDPAAAPYAAETVRSLLGKKPIFGVCMGHQILALALGGRTFKMKFGHRGGNQPVLDRASGRVAITSHNHGYSVDPASLPSHVEVTHINLNDQSVEGLSIATQGDAPAFSLQYHPEACPGPHDSLPFFEKFIEAMRNWR